MNRDRHAPNGAHMDEREMRELQYLREMRELHYLREKRELQYLREKLGMDDRERDYAESRRDQRGPGRGDDRFSDRYDRRGGRDDRGMREDRFGRGPRDDRADPRDRVDRYDRSGPSHFRDIRDQPSGFSRRDPVLPDYRERNRRPLSQDRFISPRDSACSGDPQPVSNVRDYDDGPDVPLDGPHDAPQHTRPESGRGDIRDRLKGSRDPRDIARDAAARDAMRHVNPRDSDTIPGDGFREVRPAKENGSKEYRPQRTDKTMKRPDGTTIPTVVPPLSRDDYKQEQKTESEVGRFFEENKACKYDLPKQPGSEEGDDALGAPHGKGEHNGRHLRVGPPPEQKGQVEGRQKDGKGDGGDGAVEEGVEGDCEGDQQSHRLRLILDPTPPLPHLITPTRLDTCLESHTEPGIGRSAYPKNNDEPVNPLKAITDHMQWLDATARSIHSTRIAVALDGDCLFTAIAEQSEGWTTNSLRQRVVDVLDVLQNDDSDHYTDIYSPAANEAPTYAQHLAKMRMQGTHGGERELQTAASILDRAIWVLDARAKRFSHVGGPPTSNPVVLTYRPEHFDRLEATEGLLALIATTQAEGNHCVTLAVSHTRKRTKTERKRRRAAWANSSKPVLPEPF